ncbi:hypothetical protein VBG40_10680 [Vagococcus fluvialis]|uniref:hypothetical protein n=1 Tax=Vagococcus fluvialis TaxID=2738 RepID=UPI0037B7A6E8
MLKKTKEYYYRSVADKIGERIKELSLKREEVLADSTRITDIRNAKRDDHHPSMIGPSEYRYLYDLFIFDSKEDLIQNGVLTQGFNLEDEGLINYNKMLFDYIDLDGLFKVFINELKDEKELEEEFKETLIDYVPFARMYFREVNENYGREFISKEDRNIIEVDAINWVYHQNKHVKERFKTLFEEEFFEKELKYFNKRFDSLTKNFLEERKPKLYSLGKNAYEQLKELSNFKALLYSYKEYQYSDMYAKEEITDQITSEIKVVEKYVNNIEENLTKLEKTQQQFNEIFNKKSEDIFTSIERRIESNKN